MLYAGTLLYFYTMKLQLLILLIIPISIFSQEWKSFANNEKIDGAYVYNFNDINDTLFIGGSFLFFGESVCRFSFCWDSIDIDTLPLIGENGLGIEGVVYSQEDYKNILFIGGAFDEFVTTTIEKISLWNDTSWLPVGSIGNPSGSVNSMIEYNGILYIGGAFFHIGTEDYSCLVGWDGDNWIDMNDGFGGTSFGLKDMVIYNNELVVGGMIGINGGFLEYIGSWDGIEWKGLGLGMSDMVTSLVVDSLNNFLYAGGSFTVVNETIPTNFIARWDGYKWESVGVGFNSEPNVLGMYRKELYAGGTFLQSGSTPLGYIARWDGEKWDSLQCGVAGGAVFALQEYKDELYVGGMFNMAGGDTAKGIAKWYMPENTTCDYLMPRVFSTADEYYLYSGSVEVQFYNNNAYASSWEWDFGDLGTANVKDPSHTFTDTGYFTVQVTVTDGTCVKTATKTIHIDFDSGSKEIENLNFKVFPNPSESNFTVQMDLTQNKKCELRIAGLNGHIKTIIPVESEATTIKTCSWAKGTYICNLFVDGKLVKSEKLILK